MYVCTGSRAGPWLGANGLAFSIFATIVPLVAYATSDLTAQVRAPQNTQRPITLRPVMHVTCGTGRSLVGSGTRASNDERVVCVPVCCSSQCMRVSVPWRVSTSSTRGPCTPPPPVHNPPPNHRYSHDHSAHGPQLIELIGGSEARGAPSHAVSSLTLVVVWLAGIGEASTGRAAGQPREMGGSGQRLLDLQGA